MRTRVRQDNTLFTLLKMFLIRDGRKKAKYLKRMNVFHSFGENCSWTSYRLPSEPFLVSIGNEVSVTSGVRFITHDIIHNTIRSAGYDYCDKHIHYGKIVIEDGVMLGADCIIMYNTTIGKNAVVAAGSVVVKDVPPGAVVGGNPAKIIGNIEELAKKRLLEDMSYGEHNSREEIIRHFWGDNAK